MNKKLMLVLYLVLFICALPISVSAQSSPPGTSVENECGVFEGNLTFKLADGKTGCLKSLMTRLNYSTDNRDRILRSAEMNGAPRTFVWLVSDVKACPTLTWISSPMDAGREAAEQRIFAECQKELDSRVAKLGRTPGPQCQCELVVRDGVSPLTGIALQKRINDILEARAKPQARADQLASSPRETSTAAAGNTPAIKPPTAGPSSAPSPSVVTQAPSTAPSSPSSNQIAVATAPPAANQVTKAAGPSATAAPAQIFAHRKALVIGNDNYSSVSKLLNARADANALGKVLVELGYKVTVRQDLTEKEMKSALRQFRNEVEGGDEVLFFYAGHGVQLGSANYLLPIDIKGDSEEQVKDEAIELQRILDSFNEKRVKLALAVIDACRDNPFPKSGRAIGGRGLAPTTAATGQMVVFSAGSGQQALDKLGPGDKDPNGLFTRVFLNEIRAPGVRVDNVIREVRKKVVDAAKSVGHEQVPAIYDQVVGDFYFKR
jgi:hypothetical protein